MGFFDKLKQAKNFVTGGGAKVYIDTPTTGFRRGEMANITIKADVKDADLNVANVYFKIRAVETSKAEGNASGNRSTGQGSGMGAAAVRGVASNTGNSGRQVFTSTANTFNHELIVEGQTQLEGNQSYEWTASFEIPNNVNPTYRGVNATHEWQVYAGLDCRGNDPDSGWVKIEVI